MNSRSPNEQKLGLGVLGLGEGRSIISAGLASPLWNVVQLCDTNAELGAARCQEFGLATTLFTTSFDALLANPAVDVVGIYTPDHLHAAHTIKALQAGKHVICTKPFLNDLSQAQAVLDAQARSGRQVFIGQSSRFFAPFRRQREHYQTGAFGALNTIEASYHADHRWFLAKPWAREAAFKWLFGAASHPADFIRWYLPDVAEVIGYSRLSENGLAGGLKNPDTFHFILKASSGIIARISGAYSGPVVPQQRDSGMTCILRCANGASQADYYELRYAWKLGEQAVVEHFDGQDSYYFRFAGITHHAGEYQNYLEYFARCLASGTSPKPDVQEGIVTVALLQAMEESCAQGGVAVKIKEVLARHGLEALVTPRNG